jgi:hypothetical protein
MRCTGLRTVAAKTKTRSLLSRWLETYLRIKLSKTSRIVCARCMWRCRRYARCQVRLQVSGRWQISWRRLERLALGSWYSKSMTCALCTITMPR